MSDIQKKALSYADYQRFCEMPENRDRLFEFIDGEIIEKMPSFEPSELATEIIYFLKHYLKQNPIGRLTAPDGSYIMSDDDDPDVFIPDVGYISNERLGKTPEREVLVPPDLAVEIKSPTDYGQFAVKLRNIYLMGHAWYGSFSPKPKPSKCMTLKAKTFRFWALKVS